MINQFEKYIFLYAFIRPMYTYHYLNVGPLCVVGSIAVLYNYKSVFKSSITLQAVDDISLILKVSVYNPGLVSN